MIADRVLSLFTCDIMNQVWTQTERKRICVMAAAAKNSHGRNIQVESVPTFYVLFLAQNGVLGGVLVGPSGICDVKLTTGRLQYGSRQSNRVNYRVVL
jgi:hypothetical protein